MMRHLSQACDVRFGEETGCGHPCDGRGKRTFPVVPSVCKVGDWRLCTDALRFWSTPCLLAVGEDIQYETTGRCPLVERMMEASRYSRGKSFGLEVQSTTSGTWIGTWHDYCMFRQNLGATHSVDKKCRATAAGSNITPTTYRAQHYHAKATVWRSQRLAFVPRRGPQAPGLTGFRSRNNARCSRRRCGRSA